MWNWLSDGIDLALRSCFVLRPLVRFFTDIHRALIYLLPLAGRPLRGTALWPHLAGVDDVLVSVQPLRDRVANFADLLDTDPDDPEFSALLGGLWGGSRAPINSNFS